MLTRQQKLDVIEGCAHKSAASCPECGTRHELSTPVPYMQHVWCAACIGKLSIAGRYDEAVNAVLARENAELLKEHKRQAALREAAQREREAAEAVQRGDASPVENFNPEVL